MRVRKAGERPTPPLTAARLERAGLDYLARFSASADRVKRVLVRRVRRAALIAEENQPIDTDALLIAIDALIARWIASGVINDSAYAEAKAASLHRRGLPKTRIALKLKEKGVGTPIVDAVLAQDPDLSDDLAAALSLARRRRLGPYRLAEKRAEFYQKDLASLARAGFDRRTAMTVLNAETPEAVLDRSED